MSKIINIEKVINDQHIKISVKANKISVKEVQLYESLENNSFVNLIHKYLDHFNDLCINSDIFKGDIYDTLMEPLNYTSIFVKIAEKDSMAMKSYLSDRREIEKETCYIKAYILMKRSNKKLKFDEFRNSHVPLTIITEISKVYDSI